MSDPRFELIGDPLDCLIEECSELIKAIIKIKRFGWQNGWDGKRNDEEILKEIIDVRKRCDEIQRFINKTTPAERDKLIPQRP